MTCERKNYKTLYENLVRSNPDKKKEYKRIFRKKCDSCKKMRNMTSGDVYEFSFYCCVCCDNIEPRKCSCGSTSVLSDDQCLLCFNKTRKQTMKSSMLKDYFKDCHKCNKNSFVLKFDGSNKGICLPCLEKPVKCVTCSEFATFFNNRCMACLKYRERVLSNNPFYTLTYLKE